MHLLKQPVQSETNVSYYVLLTGLGSPLKGLIWLQRLQMSTRNKTHGSNAGNKGMAEICDSKMRTKKSMF